MKMLAMTLTGILYTMLLLPGAGAGVILFSDNFDTENGGVARGRYTNFAKWDVTIGDVDLIGNGVADFYPGHGLYVDLAGTGRGQISTKNAPTLEPGTYELRFLLGNNPGGVGFLGNGITFTLGDWFQESLPVPGITPMVLISRTFILTEQKTGRITFRNQHNHGSGAIIDDVELELLSSPIAVPEPVATPILLVAVVACSLRQRILSCRTLIAGNAANAR